MRLPGFALATVGAVLALASPSLADGGGTPWTPDPGPNPSSIGNTLNGVSARTGTDAWVVGWYTQNDPSRSRNMLIGRWDGTAWTQTLAPENPATDDGLLAVSASAADEAWAVGFSRRAGTNLTVALHWNGTGWTSVAMPVTSGPAQASLNGVVSLGPTNAWAVGRSRADSGNSALLEHWNGTAWSVWPSPIPPAPPGATESDANFTGISAVSPTDIWAVGSVTLVNSPVTTKTRTVPIVEHTGNGKTWSSVPGPDVADAVLNSVVAVGANDVWAVGNTFDPESGAALGPLIEHWDGTAWSVVPAPTMPTRATLTGVTAVSPTDVWAVGQTIDTVGTGLVTRTLTLHWDGAAWSVVASPNDPNGGDTTLNATSATPDTGRVWAVGAIGDLPVNTLIIHHLSGGSP